MGSRFYTMVSRLHPTLTEGHALLKWWRYWYRTGGTIGSTHRTTCSGKQTIAPAQTIIPSRANTSSSCCRKNSYKPRYQSKCGDHRLQPPSSGPRHWVSLHTLLQVGHRPYVSKVCHRCPQEHGHRSVSRGARSHFGQAMRRLPRSSAYGATYAEKSCGKRASRSDAYGCLSGIRCLATSAAFSSAFSCAISASFFVASFSSLLLTTEANSE